jgi:hypothetical protein
MTQRGVGQSYIPPSHAEFSQDEGLLGTYTVRSSGLIPREAASAALVLQSAAP